MSKPSSRIFQGLIRFHRSQISKPLSPSPPLLSSARRSYHSNNGPPPQFPSHSKTVRGGGVGRYSRPGVGLGMRYFSFKRSNFSKINANKVFDKPPSAASLAFSRMMFGIASTFIGLYEGMAKYGFLALSTAIVTFAVSSSQSLVDLAMT
ncbi:hypothetical protein C1H46_039940 [Malus baccata]|uniref:Uncharacterized protein n=1 Tax=Malus baccata TaxID=106549 RepID=A0A540KK10_MALBA|nr:hypothetical protein C1H46_039940 [Malus baccata]